MEVKIFQHFHVYALDLTPVLVSRFAPEGVGTRQNEDGIGKQIHELCQVILFPLECCICIKCTLMKNEKPPCSGRLPSHPQLLMYNSNFLTLRKLCFPYKAL